MFDSTNVLMASMCALANELERIKALPHHDEEKHPYQSDVSSGLSELIEIYEERCQADPSLTPWRELVNRFRSELWPANPAQAVGAFCVGRKLFSCRPRPRNSNARSWVFTARG